MYMLYGMTYEQYWYGDPWMVTEFADAYLLKRRARNEELWLEGVYFANAMGITLNNAFNKSKKKYLDKPLDIFGKTAAEKEQEKRNQRKRVIEWLENLRIAAVKKETEKAEGQ